MITEHYKPLYDLLQSMGETATDIYYGNYFELDDSDIKELEEEDFEKALNNACAELAAISTEAEWFEKLFSELSECFGKYLKIAYLQRMSIKKTENN